MIGDVALSRRLGGLYCLFCLYETQPFKPPFKIYLSLGELEKLKQLVSEAKIKGIRVVPALVKRMLEKNAFLFGFVDLSYGSVTEMYHKLTRVQNERIRVAREKLFANSNLDSLLSMDLGEEFDLGILKRMLAEYAEAKKHAIEGAEEVVDVEHLRHISDDKEPLAEEMEKIVRKWEAEKELFEGQTRIGQEEEVGQLQYGRSTDESPVEGQNEEGFDEFYQLLLEYD